MRIALGIEYDGRAFRGWQRQRGARTVQEAVEAALGRVAAHPVRTGCAGRTDAGVHACGQVVHFDSAAARSMRAWMLGANVNLPPDVSVLWAREVPVEFDARFSATGRTYRYLILERDSRPALLAGRVCWTHRRLDVDAMQDAARHLVGRHDFSAFRALACQAKSPVRTVRRLDVRRVGELVVLEVEADGFLMHMVRNIAGTLMAVGCGEAAPDWAREVLEARDRTRGGVTAPAGGLYLLRVDYPERFGLPVAASPVLPG